MFQGVLREINLRGATPSFSLAVIKNGILKFIEGYPDFLIYDCASLTKPLLTFPLVEEYLDFNDNVNEYLSLPHSLKIKDLVSHTSGLIPWLPLYLYEKSYVEIIVQKGFNGKKGEKVYSCLNYILLKEILERESGGNFKKLAKNFLKRFKGCFVPPLKCVNVAPTERGNVYEYEIAKRFVKNPDKRKFRFNKIIKGETHDLNSHFSGGIAGNSGLFADVFGVIRLVENLLKYKDWFLPLFEKENYFYHLGFTGTGIAIHKDKDIFIVFLSNRVCPEVRDIDFSSLRHRLFSILFRKFL